MCRRELASRAVLRLSAAIPPRTNSGPFDHGRDLEEPLGAARDTENPANERSYVVTRCSTDWAFRRKR